MYESGKALWKPLLIVGALLAAAAAWFFVSPLFIDRAVDEELVFSPEGQVPTREDIDAMSAEDRRALREEMMQSAAAAPDIPVDESMPDMAQPTVVSRGEFRDADAIHRGKGDAILYRAPDGSHLLRFENFRVTNGPALVVYLAGHPDPASAGDVKSGRFVSLGKLKGNVGNQNYPIPANVDVSEYQSAVIWCELFDVLFSPAALREN